MCCFSPWLIFVDDFRVRLLLELGRLALDQNVRDVAQTCMDLLKENVETSRVSTANNRFRKVAR